MRKILRTNGIRTTNNADIIAHVTRHLTDPYVLNSLYGLGGNPVNIALKESNEFTFGVPTTIGSDSLFRLNINFSSHPVLTSFVNHNNPYESINGEEITPARISRICLETVWPVMAQSFLRAQNWNSLTDRGNAPRTSNERPVFENRRFDIHLSDNPRYRGRAQYDSDPNRYYDNFVHVSWGDILSYVPLVLSSANPHLSNEFRILNSGISINFVAEGHAVHTRIGLRPIYHQGVVVSPSHPELINTQLRAANMSLANPNGRVTHGRHTHDWQFVWNVPQGVQVQRLLAPDN